MDMNLKRHYLRNQTRFLGLFSNAGKVDIGTLRKGGAKDHISLSFIDGCYQLKRMMIPIRELAMLSTQLFPPP